MHGHLNVKHESKFRVVFRRNGYFEFKHYKG